MAEVYRSAAILVICVIGGMGELVRVVRLCVLVMGVMEGLITNSMRLALFLVCFSEPVPTK